MVPIVIIPGWRDSPPGHWQGLWAAQLPGAVRVQQDDWVAPSAAWGSEFVRLQNAGHINLESGFGRSLTPRTHSFNFLQTPKETP